MPITLAPATRLSPQPSSALSATAAPGGATAPASAQPRTSSVSLLAQQLSDAANHAASRDAGQDPAALAQQAAQRLQPISGPAYLANKAAYDSQQPSTDSPELQARAKQATAFINGAGDSPFAELSHEQLSLISQDDSGAFTVNERRAAWQQASTLANIATNAQPPSAAATAPSSSFPPSGSGIGYQLMLDNVFQRDKEPPVLYGFNNDENDYMMYLNREDRALISDMFTYAHEQGANIEFVQNLCF